MPNLTSKQLCTGCTACVNVCPNHCIELNEDKYGFTFPQITKPSLCIECGQCENICPVMKEKELSNISPTAYAAFSKDESMRLCSSSGGIFSELAKAVLSQSGVVYGAAYDEKFDVKHICVDKFEDLYKIRGAKYAQSLLGDTFESIINNLKNGQKILFSGTPCQVAGLKSLVGDNDNLFCVDFVCHGVPSQSAWSVYVKYRAKSDSRGEFPISINLRSKHTGWSKYRYSNLFCYKDGKIYSAKSGQDLYMKLFVGDYINRESCQNCNFKGYSRASDITLGDFWGIWDIDSTMDDNKGTSVVIVQSNKGHDLLKAVANNIVYKEVSLERAGRQNPSLLNSSIANTNRGKALRLISEERIDECERFFIEPKKTVLNRVKNKLRSLIK